MKTTFIIYTVGGVEICIQFSYNYYYYEKPTFQV